MKNPLPLFFVLVLGFSLGCSNDVSRLGDEMCAGVPDEDISNRPTLGLLTTEILIPPDYSTLAGPDCSGQTYTDPTFGTVIKRITHAGRWTTDGLGAEITNSEIAYFNSDDSKFLISENIINEKGDEVSAGHLLTGQNGTRFKQIGLDTFRPWWIRWAVDGQYKQNDQQKTFDPAQHFYKYEGNQIRLYNLEDLSHVVLHTFSDFNQIGPAGGEGDISVNGRYWLLDGDERKLFVYDLLNDVEYPPSSFDLGEIGAPGGSQGVDYAVMSALGNYILVMWSYGPATAEDQSENPHGGLEVYSKNWEFVKRLYPNTNHWSRGVDQEGNEVVYTIADFSVDPKEGEGYKTQDFWRAKGVEPGDYVSIKISDGSAKTLLKRPGGSQLTNATSVKKVGDKYVSDYIYVSFSKEGDPNKLWQPYWGEIVEIPTDGSQQIRRLVHHRSRKISGKPEKFCQPDFIISHTGDRIVFRSTFTHDYGDLYMFALSPR